MYEPKGEIDHQTVTEKRSEGAMANWLEGLKIVAAGIGAAAVGALATIATEAFGYWNTDRDQDIQMVNIALSILGGEVKDQDKSEPGRKFALRLLRKYADVEIPETEFNEWARDGTLPPDVYRPGLYAQGEDGTGGATTPPVRASGGATTPPVR